LLVVVKLNWGGEQRNESRPQRQNHGETYSDGVVGVLVVKPNVLGELKHATIAEQARNIQSGRQTRS
jgi:hypothetical protein